MKKRISKRVINEAILVCAHSASGRDFATYTSDAAEWLGVTFAAQLLAFDAVVFVESTHAYGGGWHRENYAEAEALLRTGWTP